MLTSQCRAEQLRAKIGTADDAGRSVGTCILQFTAVTAALNSAKAVGILIACASFDATGYVQTKIHFSPRRKQDQSLNAVIKTVAVEWENYTVCGANARCLMSETRCTDSSLV
jgi:hypothetical protein